MSHILPASYKQWHCVCVTSVILSHIMCFNVIILTTVMSCFQASAAMLMKSVVFWVITRCRVVIIYRRFGTTCRSHLHGSRFRVGKKASKETWQHSGVGEHAMCGQPIGWEGGPETSVNNYHTTPCNYPEDHRFQQSCHVFTSILLTVTSCVLLVSYSELFTVDWCFSSTEPNNRMHYQNFLPHVTCHFSYRNN
jgi:hypothetical protein